MEGGVVIVGASTLKAKSMTFHVQLPITHQAINAMEQMLVNRIESGLQPGRTQELRTRQLLKVRELKLYLEQGAGLTVLNESNRFLAFVLGCYIDLPRQHALLPAVFDELKLLGFDFMSMDISGIFEERVTGHDWLVGA